MPPLFRARGNLSNVYTHINGFLLLIILFVSEIIINQIHSDKKKVLRLKLKNE